MPPKNAKNEQMEAMAKDYSELHIDVSAAPSLLTSPSGLQTPRTPATFQSMVSPTARRPSHAKKKGHRFNIRRLFSKKPVDASPSGTPMSTTSSDSASPVFPKSATVPSTPRTPQTPSGDTYNDGPGIPSPMSLPPTPAASASPPGTD